MGCARVKGNGIGNKIELSCNYLQQVWADIFYVSSLSSPRLSRPLRNGANLTSDYRNREKDETVCWAASLVTRRIL